MASTSAVRSPAHHEHHIRLQDILVDQEFLEVEEQPDERIEVTVPLVGQARVEQGNRGWRTFRYQFRSYSTRKYFLARRSMSLEWTASDGSIRIMCSTGGGTKVLRVRILEVVGVQRVEDAVDDGGLLLRPLEPVRPHVLREREVAARIEHRAELDHQVL